MQTKMERFYTNLFSKEKSPYYHALHNLVRVNALDMQHQSKQKQHTRGWVNWTTNIDEEME